MPDAIPSELASFRPGVAMVLGSGLGSFADSSEKLFEIPFSAVPGLPESRVPGHAGKFVGAMVAGVRVLLALGRVHYYEGLTPRQVVEQIRLMAALGAKTLVLTNAAGTLNPAFEPGGWMMLADHINLTAVSPLAGGANFFDMSEVYDAKLREYFRGIASERGIVLHEGIYACVPGPQYETPAEVRMLRAFGADVVGMSTVFEAIQARALGMRVAAFSCLTNWGAGISSQSLSHHEVIETGRAGAAVLAGLLAEALHRGLPDLLA